MLIEFDFFNNAIREYKTKILVIEYRLGFVDDTMERGRQDNDIICIVVHTNRKRIDMVRLNHLNGILFANFFARYLATIIVQAFEGLSNAMIQFAYLA